LLIDVFTIQWVFSLSEIQNAGANKNNEETSYKNKQSNNRFGNIHDKIKAFKDKKNK